VNFIDTLFVIAAFMTPTTFDSSCPWKLLSCVNVLTALFCAKSDNTKEDAEISPAALMTRSELFLVANAAGKVSVKSVVPAKSNVILFVFELFAKLSVVNAGFSE